MKCKDCEFTDCRFRTNYGGCDGGEIHVAPYVPDYWDSLRHQAAIAAMQGALGNSFLLAEIKNQATDCNIEVDDALCEFAVEAADTLVNKLKKKGNI